MESSPNSSMRECPTRRDGAEVLIAQKLTTEMCQSRQRGYYHKCWSCAHRNGAVERPAPVLEMVAKRQQPPAEAI